MVSNVSSITDQRVAFVLQLAVFGLLFISCCIATNADSSKNWQLQKNTVLERSIHMYNNPFMSDIKLKYKDCQPGEELYAHKYMLVTSSPVFERNFYGSSATKDTVLDIGYVSKDTLEAFLAFLYKDECPTDIGVIFELLRLTKEYEIRSFDLACRDNIEEKITEKEAFRFLEKFLQLGEHTMTEVCWQYIDDNTKGFFTSEYFLSISKRTLDVLLARDTLTCDEMAIYEAVMEWTDHKCSLKGLGPSRGNRRKILGDAIHEIRFQTMTGNDFSRFSADFREKLLTDSEILDLLAVINGKDVPDLKWDLSKKKREVRYFERNFQDCSLVFLSGVI